MVSTGLGLSEEQVTDMTKSLITGHTLRADVTPGDIEEAKEAAIVLLIAAGFDEQDSDHFGADMGDTAQSLLTVVMLRVPQLRDRLNAGEIHHADPGVC